MKIQSLKFKLTFLYSWVVVLLFCLVLGGAFVSSEYYSEETIKQELYDEIWDFKQLLTAHPDALEDANAMLFFDDHIMLSVYDEAGYFINGILPEDFSYKIDFQSDVMQKYHDDEYSFYIYDCHTTLPNREVIWIRGIHSFTALSTFFQRMVLLTIALLPLLVLITAIIGYRMINRSLRPVSTISKTADDIIHSSDLSLRLEKPGVKDEMFQLTETFNHLLEHLEQQFIHEQQFSSDAAHELRTPISSILSHCEYCLDELETSDEMREELIAIRQKALQISDLISTLLSIARAENRNYKPASEDVDLEILAETVAEELQEKASEKNITIEIQNHMDSPIIKADLEMITRVFINLADNAISYGRPDGFVRIELTKERDLACIRFIDNGIGIPAESLDKIWNRFYQVDRSHSSDGFGLGLFLVKHIIDCHNGSISVKSTVGEGTIFSVTLPINP